MVKVFLSRSPGSWRAKSLVRRIKILWSLIFIEVLLANIKQYVKFIGLRGATSEILEVRKQKFSLPKNSQLEYRKVFYSRYFEEKISINISRFGDEIVEIEKK